MVIMLYEYYRCRDKDGQSKYILFAREICLGKCLIVFSSCESFIVINAPFFAIFERRLSYFLSFYKQSGTFILTSLQFKAYPLAIFFHTIV